MVRDSIYHFGKVLLPHPKYWPKKLHEVRLDRYYYETFGKHIDFKNPETFTEKMQWYMLYFEDEIAARVTDKIAFKDYVRTKLGGEKYTAKLLGKWERVEDIDFDSLTPPYVLKSNCSGDGENIAIIRSNSEISCELKSWMRDWLNWKNTFINGSSNAYWKIKPQILAEEYLEDISGALVDYKFFCFDGKPYCIYTCFGAIGEPSKITFYNTNWDVIAKYSCRESCPIEKPQHFDEMLKISTILSKGFPFVRVDFYDLPDRVIVGELTYDSSWGLKGFDPESFDYELGKQFNLPKQSSREGV